MTTAILEDKVDFVRLLLQNGVVMQEWLTVARLRFLYNSAPKMSHLRQLLQSVNPRAKKFNLYHVGNLIHELMGKHDDDFYANDKVEDFEDTETTMDPGQSFPKPFRELFLWAVLMNRVELAKFLWQRGDEGIPSAIAASHMYETMANKTAHYDSATKENYNANKKEFEALAVKLLDECQKIDPEKAAMLVERKYKTWGDANCLEMAAAAEDKEFLSTVCCQNILDMMWNRGLASPWYIVIFCILFPPAVLCLVQFDIGTENEQELTENLSAWKKLKVFYRAPVTKFAGNVMMYLLFLGLYSYLILFDFRPSPSYLEIALLGWIFTLLVEEIREMFSSKADSVLARIKDWWHFSSFNRIDMMVLLLAIIGVALRMNSHLFIQAKSVYAVNCVFLFIRLLRDYSASAYFGPKLVMIKLMMLELILYILILLVFLLAYGIASQAVMHPTRDFYWLIFRDILYYPYWQIYGELWLEEIEGRTEDCLAPNATTMPDGTVCPTFSPLTPIFTAAYMLIGNVLLLNLLIAIFTHIFDEVEKNSIQIWKFGMYFLVMEYDNKPGLCPPFILFEHIFMILKWFFRRTCCKKELKGPILTESQIYTLEVFEKEACKSMIQKDKGGGGDDLMKKINFIQHRVDEMAKLLEEERLSYEEENQLSEHGEPGTELLRDTPRSPIRRRSMSYRGQRSRSPSPRHSHDSPKIKVNDGTWTEQEFSNLSQNTMNIDHQYVQETTNMEKVKPKDVSDVYQSQPDKHNGRGDTKELDSNDPSTWDAKKAWVTFPEEGKDDGKSSRKQSKGQSFRKQQSSSDEEESKHRKRSRSKGKKKESSSSSSSDSEEEAAAKKKKKKKKEKKEKKMLNIQDDQDSDQSQKIDILEAKLASLEESTSLSLYNIEALLRNAVFQRGNTGGSTSRSSRRHREHRRATPDYDYSGYNA